MKDETYKPRKITFSPNKMSPNYLGTNGDCFTETHSDYYFYQGELVQYHWGSCYTASPQEELDKLNRMLERLSSRDKDSYLERVSNIQWLKKNMIERFNLEG